MEQFLLHTLQHIAQQMPQITLVDEDTGQLETNEDTYPVTFPCVLVGNTEIRWKDLSHSGAQLGEGIFVVRLAIDCYHDTHIGSNQEQEMATRQQMAAELYRTLQGKEFVDHISPLTRIKSRDYTLPGAIKVYEQMYSFEIQDTTAMPQ